MRVSDIFCSTPASTAVRSSTVRHAGDSTSGGRRSFERRRSQNPNNNNKFVLELPSIPLPRQMSCRSTYDVEPRRKSSAHGGEVRRKSSADVSDLRKKSTSLSRYLLEDHQKVDSLDEKWLSLDCNGRSKDPFTSSMKTRSPDQVVVLRVSIHCKGCEGKVRKHLAKMEGVTSYSIDFATKKVTVVGNVTPLEVLNSISKVKFAQFWPSSSTPLLKI